MCGFVVLTGPRPGAERESIVRRMMAAIRHRGPDDEGLLDVGIATLGFRRLSILDLSPLGHQPMSSDDGLVSLVFNGEIFNFIELRAQLQTAGHVFRSSGDTEVLLRSYLEWGVACVERFNGMWAFVIADRRRGRLFGSRDRFGIKPLFVCKGVDGQHAFASEIKAIRAGGLYVDEIDRGTVADYLLGDRLDETPATFFKGIEQLPAGHSFEFGDASGWRQWRYWDPDAIAERAQPDPAAAFADLFEDAVQMHMRSDVPVGVHLSGGLDSTSILCASARVRAAAGASGPLKAFTFADHEFDEAQYVRDTIAQTGAELVTLQTSAERVWADLPHVLASQDEPAHSLTAVIGYQLMRLTREHGIPVILNGQGADESLGGYPSYFRDGWVTLLRDGGLGATWREVTAHAQASGKVRSRLFADLLRHVMQSSLSRLAAYRAVAARRQARGRPAAAWVRPSLPDSAPGGLDHQSNDLRSSLMRSMQTSPLPIYLRVEDRNSMAHSIEARVPFLDHRLVELAFSLGREWKLRGALNKFVLREGMRGRIPESVRARRDKMGFPTPSQRWLRGELHDKLRELIGDAAPAAAEFVDRDALLALLARHRSGQSNHHGELVRAAQFLLWQGMLGRPA